MNDILKNIATRRSVRKFRKQAVEREIIEEIVEAGRLAPSALNMQPWKFIVIRDAGLIGELSGIAIERIRKLYRLTPLLRPFSKALKDQRVVNAMKKTAESSEDTVFYNAPFIIFIANDTNCTSSEANCYIAGENMALAAHSLGIGSCFIGRAKAIPKETLRKRLDLPGYYDVNVCMAFGYPEELTKTPPAKKADTVKWIGPDGT